MPAKVKEHKKIRGVFERPVGSGIWWISYQRHGVRKREKVGRKSDALDLYRVRKAEILAGKKLPMNLKHSGVPFRVLAQEALVYSAAHHKDTRTVEQRMRKLCKSFGERDAAEIRPAEIDTWIKASTKTAATANRYRATFSLVFREAVRNNRVASNPARLVRQRAENNGRIRFLKPDEEARLRAAIQELSPENVPAFVISCKTGMRLSEQYGLTWAAIDMGSRSIDLRKTKNGQPRVIPMSPEAYEAFATLRGEQPPDGDGAVFETPRPRYWFSKAMQHAGIENYRWHDNRHTFCSRLGKNKAHIKTIAQLAGHKTLSMSARYTHIDEETLVAEITKLG